MNRWLALAAGGTGGHMFPAEAVSGEMKSRGWKTLLLTDDRGMRFAEGFPADEVVVLPAANPNVRGGSAKAQMVLTMAKGVWAARQALARVRPTLAMGFGGYPSAPGLFAAATLRIPYAIHEQNAVLGRVNRKAAPRAMFVAHGFERLDRLPAIKGKRFHVGNPIRPEVTAVANAPYAPPDADGQIRVLIFGGSQGASLFAKIFTPALAAMPEDLRARLRVVHQVGDDDREATAAAYATAGIEAELAPFFSDLPDRMVNAHLVIARAGGSSVTEVSVIGRPALFVPLGIAMDDHQRANAEVLAAAGAAKLLLEAEATPEAANAMLLPWLSQPDALAMAASKAYGCVPADATPRLADHIESLLGR